VKYALWGFVKWVNVVAHGAGCVELLHVLLTILAYLRYTFVSVARLLLTVCLTAYSYKYLSILNVFASKIASMFLVPLTFVLAG